MKNFNLFFALLFGVLFFSFGCSCSNEQIVKDEEAIDILLASKVNENVKITTITEIVCDGITSSSSQTDYYYENKYHHISNNENSSIKTWYGYVGDVLYAFYYTKSNTNSAIKESSRIDISQFESTKNQPNDLINTLITSKGKLVEGYKLSSKKLGERYTINVSVNDEEESDYYTIIIERNKILQIDKFNGVKNNSIKISFIYEYNIDDIQLPTFNEYPLNVNN